MKITCNTEPNTEYEDIITKIHPNPTEQCNLDTAKGVKHYTLGQLFMHLQNLVEKTAFDESWPADAELAITLINNLVCKTCKED